MNIRELAALCGMSTSTISRALNNPPETARMSLKTYDFIRVSAKRYGYRPNYHARAFHGKKSNCIGFLAGLGANYIGMSLLEGFADALDRFDMTISIVSTRNEIQREIDAFDKMFYRNVDAIIHLPIIQEGGFRTDYLAELLKNNPGHPPILSLLGGVQVPGLFQLRMKDAEAGRTAALRQLRLGCRKFGIISSRFSAPAGLDAGNAYRSTLIENGVPPESISEVSIWHNISAGAMESLRDIDGLWVIFYLLIPECHHALNLVCDLKKLHIDTVSTLENEALLLWLQIDINSSSRICDHFASLNVFHYSAYTIGMRTGEMIMKLINTPALEPYLCELEWDNTVPVTPETK